MKTRTDTTHLGADLSYPVKPDPKGYARAYYERRAYYFGPHNTPESFVLFCEWRKRLIETGEPPAVKDVKAELKESGMGEDAPRTSRFAIHTGITIVLCLLTGLSVNLLSSPAGFAVDEEFGVITEDDRAILRGHRQHLKRKAEFSAKNPAGSRADRIAAFRAAILEGTTNGTEAGSEEGS